ncbi:MAG: hypothetical protein VYE81_06095 [Planctomycetota bacterium]|nr:hypothetical protein [Planctomycetota bacterium]
MRTTTWILPVCMLAPHAQAQNYTHAVTGTLDTASPELSAPYCSTQASDVLVNGSRVSSPNHWTVLQTCGLGPLYDASSLGLDVYFPGGAGLPPNGVVVDALTTAQDTFVCDSLPTSGNREVEVELTVARSGGSSAPGPLGQPPTDPLIFNQYALNGGNGAAGDTFVTRYRGGSFQDRYHGSDHIGVTPGGLNGHGAPRPESNYNALSDEVVALYPVYFSVDFDTASALQCSPADILVCTGADQPAQVYLSALTLGLLPDDDVDALSISRLVPASEVEVVFSVSPLSQMFATGNTPALNWNPGAVVPLNEPAIASANPLSLFETQDLFTNSMSPASLGIGGLARAHWTAGGFGQVNGFATPPELGLRWTGDVTTGDDTTGTWIFDPLLDQYEGMGPVASSPSGGTYPGMALDYASLLANDTVGGRDRVLNIEPMHKVNLMIRDLYLDAVPGTIQFAVVARKKSSIFDTLPGPLFLDPTQGAYFDPADKTQELVLVAASHPYWSYFFGPAVASDTHLSAPAKVQLPKTLIMPGERVILQTVFLYFDGVAKTWVAGVSNAIEIYEHIQ